MYDPNESLIFRVPVPLEQLEFSGERFTTAVQGETRHEHLHRYLFALQFCRRKNILDIASGEGYGAALIATIARTVTGVDISWEAIKHAKKNYAGAHFLMGRAECLPLHDQSVDVVVSFETLEHLVDHDRFFQEIKRVLKADGILVMSSPDRDVYSIERGIENKHHLKELSSEEFQALVRGNFRHSSFMGQISMAGSIVVPQSGDLSGMRVQGFRHLTENFVESAPSVPSPTYLISVASDEPIPDICTGSFDDRPFQMGLYAELQQRQIRILQGEAEIANLRTEVAARESFLLESRSDEAKASKNIVQLQAELVKRKEQVEGLRCKLTDANHKEQELAALISRQTTVSESLRAELARTQCETERRDLLFAQQSGVSESLRADLGLRQQEIERLGVMVAREVGTSNSLRAAFARKQQELDSLSSRMELEVASTTSLRAELTEKRQQIDSLFSEINKETGSVVSLQAQLAHKDLAAEAKDATLSKLSEECTSMRLQLDAIYLSKSWVLSRPLRTIAGALRKHKLVIRASLRLFAAFGSLRKIRAIRSLRLIFDRAFYLEHNPDVATARINPLLHYIIFGAGEGRDPCPLFDTSFYLERNPDVAAAKVNPLMHYLTHGAAEGRDPSALFDTSFYLEQSPDVPAGVNPLLHFIKHGADQGRDPSPLFDTSFYMERNPDVVAARVNPLAHYLQYGPVESRDPHPLFHNLYYLQQNQNVAAASAIPLVDYCERGFLQGRNPNPLFDSRYYLETNPDVALVGANPLSHFTASGFLQGRATHPLFDTAFYCERNPDILLANANPLEHFLSAGFTEDRDPHPWFDVSFYLQQSPWISQTGHNPVLHYLSWGAWEGKDPHPHFDSSYYLDTHPAVRSSGMNPLVHYILHGKKLGFDPNPYCETILTPPPDLGCTPLPASRFLQGSIQPLDYQPLITVVLPTYNSEPLYLELAIRSVQQQSYTNWELCICDDGSSSEETLVLLDKEAHRDKRINLRMIAGNRGISEATNEALSMAQGEFVAFLDHDDEITTDALEEMVRSINIYPAADVLYSDQDYVNKDGSLYSKFYKPDWSPELFCGVMYVGHLLVVRRTLALDVGGCNPRFDFVQDFEFMLRLSEKTPNIVHVPKILYHWRRLQGSVALHGDAKPGIENLQAAAVNAHFRRRGFPALATSNPSHAHRLLIHPGPRKAFPTVTVLLDATETSRDLSRSIASILDRTVYSRFEIGLLNSAGAGGNRSFGPYRVVGETLSSALAQMDSEFIALVGSDIEILTPDWLSHLLLYAERSEIACVGPLILQPDGNVFSAGLVVTGASEICMAMQGSKPESDGYAGSLSCAREVTALSPACIVVEAQKVRELKVLEQFGLGPFQVIDLCMRAGQTGLRNICNPRARVKLMRAPVRQQKPRFDASLFQNLWQNEVEGRDRYHNPNFGNTDFGVPRRNRVLMASA